jgi:hypothetical protein
MDAMNKKCRACLNIDEVCVEICDKMKTLFEEFAGIQVKILQPHFLEVLIDLYVYVSDSTIGHKNKILVSQMPDKIETLSRI